MNELNAHVQEGKSKSGSSIVYTQRLVYSKWIQL